MGRGISRIEERGSKGLSGLSNGGRQASWNRWSLRSPIPGRSWLHPAVSQVATKTLCDRRGANLFAPLTTATTRITRSIVAVGAFGITDTIVITRMCDSGYADCMKSEDFSGCGGCAGFNEHADYSAKHRAKQIERAPPISDHRGLFTRGVSGMCVPGRLAKSSHADRDVFAKGRGMHVRILIARCCG